jgi:hypothetical protein
MARHGKNDVIKRSGMTRDGTKREKVESLFRKPPKLKLKTDLLPTRSSSQQEQVDLCPSVLSEGRSFAFSGLSEGSDYVRVETSMQGSKNVSFV